MDWEVVPDPSPRPVINLVQGVRHENPDDPRRRYLSRPAVSICISKEIATAILDTDEANRPVHLRPQWHRLQQIHSTEVRDIDALIAGIKNPALAQALQERLVQEGVTCRVLTQQIPRKTF
jgi:hypothetical protein